jgi:thiamine transport system substrate-binding protein
MKLHRTPRLVSLTALLFTLAPTLSGAAPKTSRQLTVYTYSAFTSEWGPGAAIKKSFEQSCSCELKYVAVDDGATLLKRLKLEGKKSRADVALGFDSNMSAEALTSGLFAPSEVELPKNLVAPMHPTEKKELVPFDYGWIAIMVDSQKVKQPPKDLDDLLTRKEFARSLLLEDPRTSAPGLAMLVWLHAHYGETWSAQLAKLRAQTLTVSPGWTEAYGLFTKGEAPLVVSYTTSEIYHRVAEKNERYRAAIFPSHYAITEFGAITRSSTNKDLARQFLRHLLTPETQKTLAENNWMYPAIDTNAVPGLNRAFVDAAKPSKTLLPQNDANLQKRLVEAWLRDFR